MRVLVLTKIFPNCREPDACAFNRQQFRALADHCEVDVLAGIPWFPGARWFERWSRAGRLVGVPEHESIEGLAVDHPRFVYIPKIGAALSGHLYAASLSGRVLEHRDRVDVLLGSWAYPDGFAAVRLAKKLDVPAVVKVHGSDLDVLSKRPDVKLMLGRGLRAAARVVAVSRPLAERLVELGVEPERIDVVPNGVDPAVFKPMDRARARAKLGLSTDARIVLYVGRVEREKGALDLVRALAELGLGHVEGWIVGGGPALWDCAELARQLDSPTWLAGPRPHREISDWLAACDVLALPSWHEGTPNAVIEALASGRRVVATDVGGIPDLVTSSDLGQLVPPKRPTALARALAEAVSTPYVAARVRAQAAIPTWQESATLLHRSLEQARSERARKVA